MRASGISRSQFFHRQWREQEVPLLGLDLLVGIRCWERRVSFLYACGHWWEDHLSKDHMSSCIWMTQSVSVDYKIQIRVQSSLQNKGGWIRKTWVHEYDQNSLWNFQRFNKNKKDAFNLYIWSVFLCFGGVHFFLCFKFLSSQDILLWYLFHQI